MREIINLVEDAAADKAAYWQKRAAIDAETARARTAFQEAREAGDMETARMALKAFNASLKAMRELEAEWEAKQAQAAPAAPEEPEDYRGQHTAPDHESGAPLWDVTGNGIYPDDFYQGLARQYLSDPDEQFVLGTVLGYHKRPNAGIKIYRSIPTGLPRKINVGDWVTTSRRYAAEHGRASLRNDYVIVSKTVAARDIFTAGDSLLEWGYDPQPRVARSPVKVSKE
jgi:hypothetical protein